MKVIPTAVHGVLDYLTAIGLVTLPRLVPMSETIARSFFVMGVIVFAYSLLTRYELGALRLISMKAHLALDVLSAVLFIGAAIALRDEPDRIRQILVGVGVFEIIAVLLSRSDAFESRRADTYAHGSSR
jgi:hypothetical protein